MGTSLRYQFNTYKIAQQSDEALINSNNLFALIVLVAKRSLSVSRISDPVERDRQLLDIKKELAELLLSGNIDNGKIRVLMDFLRHYVLVENPEIKVKFEHRIDVLTERRQQWDLKNCYLSWQKRK